MNETTFKVLQVINVWSLGPESWDIIENVESTREMFGSLLDFSLNGKWLVVHYTADEISEPPFLDDPELRPPFVLNQLHYAHEVILLYPMDKESSHESRWLGGHPKKF